jgi:tetratricopeptide (TPR) repeat protein
LKVNLLIIAIFAAALGTEEPVKAKAAPRANTTAAAAAVQDPVTLEYYKILEKDEAALQKIEKIMQEYQAFEDKGAAGPRGAMLTKIDQLVDEVKKTYDDFLQRNPKHVEGYLAYGSFLNELGEEEAAIEKWEKARELDPKNPSAWNNLANIFGHIGPVKKAFQYYEKAIELDPKEPVYVQNLATTTYLFRKDAAETYRIDEEAVFNKALDLYKQAMKLDPTNIVLATDYAQSYYGIKPLRTNDAIAAWEHCLTLAKSEVEKQGVYLHLARVELNSGKFEEAQKHLDMVKDPSMNDLKTRLQKNLDRKMKGEPDEGEKKAGAKLDQPAEARPAEARVER